LLLLLDVLAEQEIPATFFVVADDFPPAVIRQIAASGHEIASHSVTHPHFGRISEQQWKTEIYESKEKLEALINAPVKGFRTPSWSVPYARKEAFHELLFEAGYLYDSSFCAFETYLYGDRRFAAEPYQSAEGIWEIPVPIIGWPKAPWIGGFYFRAMPRLLLRHMIARSRPAFLYVHPWEFYAGTSSHSNLRDHLITHYGRRGHLQKLRRMLNYLRRRFQFVRMDSLVPDAFSGRGNGR
jgi:peptidoglycan/xylan/chitin deacetylase (PgdA/CDA1 family)